MEEEVVMHMHDWNNYRQQLVAGAGSFGKLNPDTVKGYATLSGAGQKAGHVDDKTRQLISLADAISLTCAGSITVHNATACRFVAYQDNTAVACAVSYSSNSPA